MNRKVVVLIAVLGLVSLNIVGCSRFGQVKNKMESFASGAELLTGLTREDFINLANEYENLPPANQKALRRGSASDRLMVHFVVLPTLRVKGLLITDPDAYGPFKAAIERSYKKFWPAYHNELINGGKFNLKIPKMSRLYDKLSKRDATLSMKDFTDAKAEIDAWGKRLRDLVEHEDVLSDQTELSSILNVMNFKLYRIIIRDILPLINSISDPQRLTKIYHDKVRRKFNITREDGHWVDYS